MSVNETREQYKKIVTKLRESRKYSALVLSENCFQKYNSLFIPIFPLLLEVLSLVPSATKLIKHDGEIASYALSIFFVIGHSQVGAKIISVFLNIDNIDDILEWFYELHHEQENTIISNVYAEQLRKIQEISEFFMRYHIKINILFQILWWFLAFLIFF